MKSSGLRLVLSAVLAIAACVPAASARTIVVREALTATGVDADARGKAVLMIRERRGRRSGRLTIKASRLQPRADYVVTIDGVPVGSLLTSRSGKGRTGFVTTPRRDDQLLGVDPRGRSLAVVAGDGAAVLGATLSDDSLDPADVRCCLPDDSGAECEDRTPAECAAQGGVDLGPGSCLPDPCSTIPPADGDIRCCLPDDAGFECEDRTPAECAAQAGINVGAGACTPNPCGVDGATTSTTLPSGARGSVRVRCERGASRSKVSVDGNGLAPGSYRAEVTSGAFVAVSELRAAVGDEAEFDFDSDPGDIATGSTAIATDFIQGDPPQVVGRLLDLTSRVVASATAICTMR